MVEQDTIRLLRECDAGVKMGISSIEDVLDHVKDTDLKQNLAESKRDHETVERELKYQGTALTLQSMWQREDPQTRILLEAANLFEKQTGAVVTILWSGEYAATPEKPEKTERVFASLKEKKMSVSIGI